ncbi:hypothetical protein GGS23DRAFT_580755 [Durotheca rogersii]|uniref:uncharacterized protein n=1 Tax=Durotheca rogersii TaxID=419775 RepID=UPI00221FCF41|nr:uncharacterized protein GGS23DRAFT_580755 [Durotheca rogersii]KAI5860593.1 hypothetical protein GGS23DRAFT_580755 [Durotheca rogersii]
MADAGHGVGGGDSHGVNSIVARRPPRGGVGRQCYVRSLPLGRRHLMATVADPAVYTKACINRPVEELINYSMSPEPFETSL